MSDYLPHLPINDGLEWIENYSHSNHQYQMTDLERLNIHFLLWELYEFEYWLPQYQHLLIQ